MGSSGAAVVFAGGTVVIATASLAITGLGVLTSIGLSTALVVLSAVAAAITLLPALLGLLGDRIDTGRLVRRHRPAKRAEDTAWWRFAHRVSGRPVALPDRRRLHPARLRRPGFLDADRLPGRG